MAYFLLENGVDRILQAGGGLYLQEGVTPPVTPSFGSALVPGSINKKYVVYFGFRSQDYTKLSAIPKGTFIATTAAAAEVEGRVTQTLHGFDIVKEFDFPIYADFPHPLYGSQTDVRYDPKYNLTNPSGDLKTWVCDAKGFMTALTDNSFFSAEFKSIFGAVVAGSPVGVYVGAPGSPAANVTASAYTWNPATGTVTFSANQSANAVISIDGVPQSMAPENMIKHLFVDYASWNPVAMQLQPSNCLIPAYVGARGRTVWQIAQDIAAMTAPRFVKWQIRIDEYGQINFYESKIAVQPTETLTDERDIFNLQYTFTSEQLSNVVTADAVSNTNQPLKSVAYSVPSINDNGQRNPFAIPSNLLLCTRGMNTANAISVLNTFTASKLDELAKPTLELTCDVFPNYNRQVGDKITILERSVGASGPYIIKGITDEIIAGKAKQTLRLRRANIFANMNMGLPAGVTNATLQTLATNTQAIGGRTNLITSLAINNSYAIFNGATNKDAYGSAVVPIVSPTATWSFAVTIDPTQIYDTVLFHYLYMDSPNTLSSSPMAIRMAGFNDGTIIPAATVGAGATINVSHTTGTALGGSEVAYFYNNLIVAGNAATIPSGTNAITATITNSANAVPYIGATTSYGIAYGSAFTGTYAYLPNLKINYGFICILACNSNGATSFLRVPFIVSL